MCATYEGQVARLDYKSLRYPGHFEAIRFCFDELGLRGHPELIAELLQAAKPPVDDDVVYLHAAVEGKVPEERTRATVRREYVRAYAPLEINGRTWRAISWTTAAAVAAVVELVAEELLEAGFLKQEDIPFEALLATRNGARFGTLGLI